MKKLFDVKVDKAWEILEIYGRRIGLEFNEIKSIALRDINTKLLNLLGDKYSPLNKAGKVNQGYLYEINEAAGSYLMNLVNRIKYPIVS